MIPAPPLSEHLLRLAYWSEQIRNGTHEMTQDGKEAFVATLHACAEMAERLEGDLKEARDAAFGQAARRVVAEVMPAADLPIPSDHLTTLVAIASGQVPGVVLLPVRQARALRFGEAGPTGGGAA